jgi:hypothetical protein
MSDRSIRRAAERQALKDARKAAVQQAMQSSASPTPAAAAQQPETTSEPSAARLAANRANAQFSSGPTSPIGKAVSSLNALKTGLTGVTVLLPSDDAAAYKSHILSYERLFTPVGPEESALTQSIADLRWRLNRIPALEMALISLGRQELAAANGQTQLPDLDPVLEVQIRRAYAKDFRNLNLQEARLARRREKEMAELCSLQAARKAEEEKALNDGVRLYTNARHLKQSFDFDAHGFEFSKPRFIAFLAAQVPPIKYEELTQTMPATA